MILTPICSRVADPLKAFTNLSKSEVLGVCYPLWGGVEALVKFDGDYFLLSQPHEKYSHLGFGCKKITVEGGLNVIFDKFRNAQFESLKMV